MTDTTYDFTGLKALYFNATLTKGDEDSHTGRLINLSKGLMDRHGVGTEVIKLINYPDIATGVYPDMTERGWDKDTWPELYKKVQAADILVLGGPIWLGDNSSVMKKIVERLYANSSQLNDKGQYAYYGKVGGCLITGNEDGAKHCAMNLLYSLQHIGYAIPPQADAAWLGEIGPGPSYGDKLEDGSRAGYDNEFTNRNLTFMTWNLMHLAKMLKESGGMPAYGNLSEQWQQGERFGFEKPANN